MPPGPDLADLADGRIRTHKISHLLANWHSIDLLQLIFAFKRLHFSPLIFFANSGLAIVRQDNGVCGGLDYFMRVNLESEATTSPLVAIQLCYRTHHRHHI